MKLSERDLANVHIAAVFIEHRVDDPSFSGVQKVLSKVHKGLVSLLVRAGFVTHGTTRLVESGPTHVRGHVRDGLSCFVDGRKLQS